MQLPSHAELNFLHVLQNAQEMSAVARSRKSCRDPIQASTVWWLCMSFSGICYTGMFGKVYTHYALFIFIGMKSPSSPDSIFSYMYHIPVNNVIATTSCSDFLVLSYVWCYSARLAPLPFWFCIGCLCCDNSVGFFSVCCKLPWVLSQWERKSGRFIFQIMNITILKDQVWYSLKDFKREGIYLVSFHWWVEVGISIKRIPKSVL